MSVVNLDRLQSWIDQGRINPSRPITLVELKRSGIVSSVRDGIKLLARVGTQL
jgi:large subunit ribosomal protein L15